MQSILEQITDWLKSMIISGIMGNLSGMFDSVNQQVGQIAGDVGTTPANFSPAVFSMIRNISESVILPIAGMVLTFIACYELIQMLIEHNNLANFETWTFFKWVFKTFLAVTLISNTFNITMAVFDVAQQVISRSGGLISGSTSVSDATLTAMQATLEGMDLGPLLGLYLQTFVVQVTMLALSAIIFVIVYGGVYNSAALHHVSGLYHDAVDCIKEQLVQAVCFQKMTEFAQRCFIRNRFRHEVNTCEFSHGVAVVDGVLGRRVGQIEPDLKQIHSQHFFNAHGRTATFSLRVVGFDNTNPLIPGNDLVHDFQKFLPLRFLLAEAVFDIRKCFLFLHHHTPPLL